MDFKDDSFTSFMPEHLLKILSALEKDVTNLPWKVIRNSGSFTLIIDFPAKGDDKGKRKPSKKRASGLKSARKITDKKHQDSSVVRGWSCEPNNQLNVCTTSVTEGEVGPVKLV